MHVGTDCSCFDERTDLNDVVETVMTTDLKNRTGSSNSLFVMSRF